MIGCGVCVGGWVFYSLDSGTDGIKIGILSGQNGNRTSAFAGSDRDDSGLA